MPIRQTMVNPPTRMKMSTTQNPSSVLFGRELADRLGLRLREELLRQEALDHEQNGERAANRDRQIGKAHRNDRKFRDVLMPGRLAELDAPHEHEQIRAQHQHLYYPS